ncbi:hypothetical protein KV112_03350 [Mycolicibacter sp. MYC123]|uniref:ATPase n=2 Tax=Mycolicibacter TaxID=1073531 RepID=A0ABU5YFF1_9MYCO|nr:MULTISPECIES: hypothetical protein [unclassified Mycolicibacter]MEB3048781.1 hypothetical protein [Mycolicibacter sp. MYC123]MEB3070016.1 hypothetical protein [Mycolicibacter sp. MYC017]
MTQRETERQARQQRADIDALYELVEGIDQKVDALDATLGGRIDALDATLGGRIDALGTTLGGQIHTVGGQLSEVLELLRGR